MRPGEEIVRVAPAGEALRVRARAANVPVRELQLTALARALDRCLPGAPRVTEYGAALVVCLGAAAERFDEAEADRVIATMESELSAPPRGLG